MTQVPVRRAAIMGAALLLTFSAMGVRLGYVQVVHAGSYAAQAKAQHVRKIDLPARRGTIFDRKGGELAVSVPARTIYANPKLIADPRLVASKIAKLLAREEASVEADLRKETGFVYLARRIGIVTADKIAEMNLPGIGILEEARRLYPGKTLASNVVGLIGTDQVGLGGLEYAYDSLLGGKPGHRVLEADPQGRRIPQGLFSEVRPVAGSDLLLTIDPDVQMSAERAVAQAVEETGAKAGMAVAISPKTGEIIAMASAPTFDPNDPETATEEATRNRPVTDSFEPGSVSKVVTAAAALDSGVVDEKTAIYVPSWLKIGDKTFLDERTPPGSYDLGWILSHSSNLGTIRTAQMVGAQRLEDYMGRLGYGRGTGLGFPGESAGNLPDIDRWSTALPTMAIGQSLSVTQLQLAQIYAMIANDGVMIEPRLVSGWIDPEGDTHRPDEARQRRVLPPDVASQLRKMLVRTVTEGSGKLAAVPHHEVAGKTGTARRAVEGIGYSGHIASFVGMFPASDPELVIAVTLNNPVPIEGGLVAAPVFSKIATDAAQILRIRPR